MALKGAESVWKVVKSKCGLFKLILNWLSRGFINFLCRRSVGFYSQEFLVFLMKESKRRRQKQPGKLMAKSRSQPVNLPAARPLMNPLVKRWIKCKTIVSKLCFSFMRHTRQEAKYRIFQKKSFQKLITYNPEFQHIPSKQIDARQAESIHELFLAFRSSLFLRENYKHTLFCLEYHLPKLLAH